MRFFQSLSVIVCLLIYTSSALPVAVEEEPLPSDKMHPVIAETSIKEKTISKREANFGDFSRQLKFSNNGGRLRRDNNNNNNNNANVLKGGFGIFFNNNENFNGANFVGRTSHTKYSHSHVESHSAFEHTVTQWGK